MRIVSEAVRSTPLVVYSCDPYEHVARLARPEANVTGVTCMTTELSPKRLELLKEAVPTISRVVFLHDTDDAPAGLKLTEDAAPHLGIRLHPVQFKDRADIPNALAVVVKQRPDALFIYPDPIGNAERRQIAEFALRQRLPNEPSPVSPPVGPRAALDSLHHLDHLGPRGVAAGEAGPSARPGDAPADRARGLVELNAAGARVRVRS